MRLKKKRHEAFIMQSDHLLDKHLKGADIVVLCGPKRYTSAFLNRTIHARKIISVLNGSYNRLNEKDFSILVWPSLRAFIHEKVVDEINEYSEKMGEGLTEEGIVDVWTAITEGRGETLLVEKNYEVKGYIADAHPWQLCMRPPKGNFTVIPDVINTLLESLMEKNGRVIFTEEKALDRHQHIAVITRY